MTSGSPRRSQECPVSASMFNSRFHPGADDLPLKLRKDRELAGHSSPSRRSQIQGLIERDERDAKLMQFIQSHDKIGKGPAPAIQSRYDYRINLTPPSSS